MGNKVSTVYWNENTLSYSAKVNSDGEIVSSIEIYLYNNYFPIRKAVKKGGKIYLE